MNSRKNRFISGLLSFVMMFTLVMQVLPPIEVSAADPELDTPKMTSPSISKSWNSSGFYTGKRTSAVDCSDGLELEWTDVGADYYNINMIILSGDPNPGTSESREYQILTNEHVYDTYLYVDAEEFENYPDYWVKIAIQPMLDGGDSSNGGYGYMGMYYFLIDEFDVYFELSEDYFEFDADGGKDTFYVYADSAYTLEVTEGEDWLSLSSSSGSADKKITITCDENTTVDEREGEIEIYHKSSGNYLYVDVWQEGYALEPSSTFPNTTETMVIGQTYEFTGTATAEGADIDIVHVNIQGPDTQTVGVSYYRETDIADDTYDYSDIDSFVWGDTLKSCETSATMSTNEPGKYWIIVYTKDEYGGTSERTHIINLRYPEQVLDTPELYNPDISSTWSSNGYYTGQYSGTIPCNEDVELEWDDVDADYYALNMIVLSGSPNPASSSENRVHEIELNYHTTKTYYTIDTADLEDYAGKWVKVSIQPMLDNGDYGYRGLYYFKLAKGEPVFTFDADVSDEISLGESITWSGSVTTDTDAIDNVSVCIMKGESDGIYYRATSVGKYTYNLANLNSGSMITGETAPSGWAPLDDNGNWEVYDSFIINEPGTYYVQFAASTEDGYYDISELYPVVVTEADAPVITATLPSQVTIGDVITISGTITSPGSVIDIVSIEVSNPAETWGYYPFRQTSVGANSFSLNTISTKTADGTVTSGGIKTGGSSAGYVGTSYTYSNDAFDFSEPGTYKIAIRSQNEYGVIGEYICEVELVEAVDSGILGDVNSDGEVTNLDRFVLNRYLNSMSGYTANMVNKESADIDGDGNLTEDDSTILARHLFGWIGYEDLSAFYIGPTTPPVTDTSVWDMSFSSNAVTIEVELTEGTPDSSKNYLFIAEDEAGLHYTGIIDAGKTSASFSVKGLQMPRGEMYSYYVLPEGVVLAGNKDKYCIAKCVVPLFNGNMITSVKSADRTVAKKGNIFLGDSVTIAWDGSYGVENFRLVVTLNDTEILNKTFNHDGPGVETISADTISAVGTGTLIIAGYVEPSASSGLSTAVSTWSGNVIEVETEISDIDASNVLNKEASALYAKNEAVGLLRLDTYYYYQAFSDELTSGTHWGSKWENVRADISNIVNGVFSSPTTLFINSSPHALLKQAVRTKLLALIGNEDSLTDKFLSHVLPIDSILQNVSSGVGEIFKVGTTLGGENQDDILKYLSLSINYNTIKNTDDVADIVDILNGTQTNYGGVTYNLSQFFTINDETAEGLVAMMAGIKQAKPADKAKVIANAKSTYSVNMDKIDATSKLGNILLGAELAGRCLVHVDDMCSLIALSDQFDEYEEQLNDMIESSDGLFKECITEVMDELRTDAYKLVLSETVCDLSNLIIDKAYEQYVVGSVTKLNPYLLLAQVSNGIITGLADTDTINKGELTLPYIVDAMNNTISKLSYTYSLFMMNPSNTLYNELKALFNTYKFQVELGAEVYLNINMSDYNSYLKRFARFVNPFDNEDAMPEQIQGCYDQDIYKLESVLTWFGFN